MNACAAQSQCVCGDASSNAQRERACTLLCSQMLLRNPVRTSALAAGVLLCARRRRAASAVCEAERRHRLGTQGGLGARGAAGGRCRGAEPRRQQPGCVHLPARAPAAACGRPQPRCPAKPLPPASAQRWSWRAEPRSRSRARQGCSGGARRAAARTWASRRA